MSDGHSRNRQGRQVADDHEDEASSGWNIPPFWQKLNSFFLFPLQMEPMIYASVLSLCGFLLMGGFFFALVAGIGLMLAVSRYAFKVAALASRGITDSADYRSDMMDDAWKALPWKFFGVLLVHGFVIGWTAGISPALGAVANLLSSLAIPATLMVLINTCSLRAAINPFELLGTIAGIGKSYLLLCLFLFLLMQGVPMALGLLLPIVPRFVLAPLITFVMIYFSWVMAAMIGYVMYQHHAALDIDPVKAPDSAPVEPEDPAAAEARRRDAMVARLVQDGDMKSALDNAREWQRTGWDNAADQRRYHRLLKLTDRTDHLAQHAQRFIPLLVQQQRESEALEVWGSCYKRAPQFTLDSADHTLALARFAWKGMQSGHVLALLQGFEKQHPGHDRTPEALELIVRALKQGANKPDQALRVFMRMKTRYPDHPGTQEAEWILRDDLQKVLGQDPAKASGTPAATAP